MQEWLSMIKLRQLISEATIACGECLNYVWQTYMVKQDDKQANKKMKITFGTVQNKWISKGKRYKHAWVEDGNLVKDWQTMKAGSSKWAGKGWPKREYYKAWNPKDMKKYTPFDAAENYRQTKSMMGWDW